jgi:hypothetical protein
MRRQNDANVVENRLPHTLLCPMVYAVLAGEYADVVIRKMVTEDLALLLAQGDSRREEPYTLCDDD